MCVVNYFQKCEAHDESYLLYYKVCLKLVAVSINNQNLRTNFVCSVFDIFIPWMAGMC